LIKISYREETERKEYYTVKRVIGMLEGEEVEWRYVIEWRDRTKYVIEWTDRMIGLL